MSRKPKPAAAEAQSAEDIMRQYDRESATRVWEGVPAVIVKYITAAFSVYCIWSTLFSTADLPIRLSAFLGLIIIMGYLTYPAKKSRVTPNTSGNVFCCMMLKPTMTTTGSCPFAKGVRMRCGFSPPKVCGVRRREH